MSDDINAENLPPQLQMFDRAKRKERPFVTMQGSGLAHVLLLEQPGRKRAGTQQQETLFCDGLGDGDRKGSPVEKR